MKWTSDRVFCDFLGVEVVVEIGQAGRFTLTNDERMLTMPDLFLASAGGAQPADSAVPSPPFETLHADRRGLDASLLFGPVPILFGSADIDRAQRSTDIGFDILGTVFFLLSRYEESVLPDRDTHDRFPASASVAANGGFLDRPIVDEYVHVLWQLMRELWPSLPQRDREGHVVVTCDVDTPFDCARSSARTFGRRLAGDLLKRRDLKGAGQRIGGYYSYLRGRHEDDDNFTFDWYMDRCERRGRKATFFFIPGRSAGDIDGCYSLRQREIRKLIGSVSRRGHEVGVHGSYNTYKDSRRISSERQRMIDVCGHLGADTAIRGNRQHYLRWDTLETPDNLEEAGFDYDSTGGYADASGFRYGTARPFPMWSWRANAPLELEQRPLVLMETTLFSPEYMGMDHSDETLDYVQTLKRRAMRHGGDFTLLWHNSSLKTARDRVFFDELIK